MKIKWISLFGSQGNFVSKSMFSGIFSCGVCSPRVLNIMAGEIGGTIVITDFDKNNENNL